MIAVYVYRDADGAALYVGQTSNLAARESAHWSRSDWRPLAVGPAEVLSEHETRRAALDAEAVAIRELRPRHNVVHNGVKITRKRAPRPYSGPISPAGSVVEAARLALGLTREELADLAGVSAARIAEVELGHLKPGRRITDAIARAMADKRGAA